MKYRYTAALFLLTIAVLCVFLRRNRISDAIFLKALPSFNTVDVNGNQLNRNKLIGRSTYIQLVNPLVSDEIELFRLVCANWKDENLNIIALSENSETLMSTSDFSSRNIYILSRDYSILLSKFRLIRPNRAYFLADSKGNIVLSGSERNAYKENVKVKLQELVKQDEFDISAFISKNSNINSVGWLKQLAEIASSTKREYLVFSLFTRICDSCGGGPLIHGLKQISGQKSDLLQVVAIVPGVFSQDDITNLRSQLSIPFPVVIADAALNQKWSYFIDRFSEYALTDILLLVSKTGDIIDVADQKYGSLNDLITRISNISIPRTTS